jgi:hypothetical protein
MKTNKLSTIRIDRIREQGYTKQSENEINDLAFGNRFAYRLCVSVLVIGLVLQSIPILSAMMVIAFFGVVLPNHPFDYLYNSLLSKVMNKPKLPKRSVQLKFACSLATVWIGGVIYLFSAEHVIAAYIVGGLLITVATLVASIDFCIPSIIFNNLFLKKKKSVAFEA